MGFDEVHSTMYRMYCIWAVLRILYSMSDDGVYCVYHDRERLATGLIQMDCSLNIRNR